MLTIIVIDHMRVRLSTLKRKITVQEAMRRNSVKAQTPSPEYMTPRVTSSPRCTTATATIAAGTPPR